MLYLRKSGWNVQEALRSALNSNPGLPLFDGQVCDNACELCQLQGYLLICAYDARSGELCRSAMLRLECRFRWSRLGTT